MENFSNNYFNPVIHPDLNLIDESEFRRQFDIY